MRFIVFKSPRQKIVATTLFTALFAGVVLGLIAWPSVTTIKNLADQIYEQRLELEQLYQKGQVLKQTLREYEEVKESIPTLNRIYLTRGNELEFVTTLEEVANRSGVSHDLKLSASDPKKPTNQLQYQLMNSGNLSNFIRYLAALESLDYYVNINTVRISTNTSSGNDASDGVLQAILLATSYFKP